MESLVSVWSNLSVIKRVLLVISLFLILSLTGLSLYWVSRPSLTSLYENLDEKETALIVSQLDEMGISYTFSDDGSRILVHSEDAHNTRYHLAAEGFNLLNPVGFELFDNADFGLTEFAQKVNYQRALEGELARTISAMESVKSARVHLTLPSNGALIRRKEQPKASVVITSQPGYSFSRKQIYGIQDLVASSVSRLSKENVSVVNEFGNVINHGGSPESLEQVDDRLKYKKQAEDMLASKLNQLIGSLFHADIANIAVDMCFNFDRERSTVKGVPTADPKGHLLKKKQNSSGSGITVTEKDPKSQNYTIEEEYVYGSETTERVVSVGSIERISVAVAVKQTLSLSDKNKLVMVLSAAAGINEQRGDRLVVESMMFGTDTNKASLIDLPLPGSMKKTLESNGQPVLVPSAEWFRTNVSEQVIAIIFVVLLTFFAVAIPIRGYQQKKMKLLSSDQKAELLADIKQWVALSESSSSKRCS